jgi:hypothetical protein
MNTILITNANAILKLMNNNKATSKANYGVHKIQLHGPTTFEADGSCSLAIKRVLYIPPGSAKDNMIILW